MSTPETLDAKSYSGFIDEKGTVVFQQGQVTVLENYPQRGYLKLRFPQSMLRAIVIASARHRYQDFPCYSVTVSNDYDDEHILHVRVSQMNE